MTLLVDTGAAQVYAARWEELLDVVPWCDAMIVDAPYSERTHAGHDDGAAAAGADYRRRVAKPSGGTGARRKINYSPWSAADVHAFVTAWSPRTRGWFVTITDDTLTPIWKEALEAAGRYVFAALPFVAPGSRVRLTGDGPSSWTAWIVSGIAAGPCEADARVVVARPTTRDFATWGTLPGAYVLPRGHGGAMPVVGGKPIWLMSQLIEHYTRPGDLVCDPCCGAGTTLAAALRPGLVRPERARRAVGCDADPEHAALAARWVQNPQLQSPVGKAADPGQLTIGGL